VFLQHNKKLTMHNFEDIVKKCYQKNSDEEISNGSTEHAKILANYL
jgi:hypothetical protein